MVNKIEVELGPVQETLLIPLLGRAVETEKPHGLFKDIKAAEIIERLDYDFGKWKRSSFGGFCIRALLYDEQVKRFLDLHPAGTVVEIGAGLNTRFERLDNGRARWLEIDLPDSMSLRRRFFADNERRTMLAADALDGEWHEKVAALPPPYLFISEAVLIYLDADDAKRALAPLAKRFPGSWLLMDITSTKAVESQHRNPFMKKMSKASWFRWKCDDPRALSAWGLELEESQTFADAPAHLIKAMPLVYRLMMLLAPRLAHKLAAGYSINRYRLAPTATAEPAGR